MRYLALLSIFLMLCASPADAAVIGAAISAIAGAFAGASAAVMVVGRLLLSVAISAYQKRRMKKKMAQRQSGITTQFLGTGGTTPLTVIVGRYATNGHLEAPQMSHDGDGKPNVWLTYVIGLGDLPGIVPTGRVVINDRWYTITSAENPSWPGYGFAVDAEIGGYALFRFRTGYETTADAWLISKYGTDPERPWLPDMIGRGIPQAIVNLYRDADRFPGEPRLRFEVMGLPLYDPRRDSSVGGTGAQRWSAPSTWESTDNPKVIEYNIHRGINIYGFGIWGNRARAEELPLANWFAAMNACDVLIDNGAGGTEKAYVFGFEFSLDTPPAQIIDEINRSCGGETVEVGGVWKTRVGGVGLPVYFLTDGDIIVTRPQELDPFPGLDATFNAFSCSFPDPDILWEARESPPLTNATWELEDGILDYDEDLEAFVRRPRRLLRDVSLPGVSNPRQVQRLISAMAREGRKRISHVLTLTPEALALEPLDAVAWTSARNGYEGKIFDVVLTADPITTLRPRIGLLEADPSDYTPPPYVPLPVPSTSNPAFTPRSVTGFAVEPYTISNGAGMPRRPALRLSWNGVAMQEADAIVWEVRLAATDAIVAQGSEQHPIVGAAIVSGLLPDTDYGVRAIPVSDRPSVYTPLLPVRTPDVRLDIDELAQSVRDTIDAAAEEAASAAGIDAVMVLPEAATRLDQIVLKKPEMVLYRWTGTTWSTQIYAEPQPGSIGIAQFASGVRPVEILAALPSTGNTDGRTVFLTTNGKTYRWTAGAWTASVASVDVTGQLTDAQIAAVAAAKVTGQITQTQITDGSISTSKIAAAAIVADKIGAGAIVADKIAANAITAAKIGAGQITAGKIAAGAVTADEIAANAITTGKIAAGAVTASQIAAGEITASKLAITDATNLLRDGEFYDPADWILTGTSFSFISSAGSPFTTSKVAVLNGDAASFAFLRSGLFPVKPGDLLQVIGSARVSAGAGGCYVDFLFYDQDEANAEQVLGSPVITSGSVTEFSTPVTVPAGKSLARFRLVKVNTGATQVRFGGIKVLRRLAGELIVDGSITAAKIGAGQIVANSLAASSVVASKIATGAVTAEKLDTESLAVAGLASFGGDLKSLDYAAGTSGWSIKNDGTAEFGTIHLREGAVTEYVNANTASAITISSFSTDTVIQTVVLNRVAKPTQLIFSVEAETLTDGQTQVVFLFIYRGSVLVGTSAGYGILTNSIKANKVYSASIGIDTYLGEGSTTYTLRARLDAWGRGSAVLTNRFLQAQQFKR
ncbi:MAG: phage tail protein [Pseudotabrizicola sp.]|uniref:phage tail protein n=1 Tax=Pseudotabrizicola sp. TaxID=2939647 RepID=UPI002715FF44|nr:phage tail protein [Pseudotabrizicola sp.]MDO9639696.1 phage tail protein [Pseudotabrizicola sp.]